MNATIHPSGSRTTWLALLALVLAAAFAASASAQENSTATVAAVGGAQPTWAENILPIFQARCQECHRPNSIAPMSLMTYEDARRYATRIRQRVENRIMPPQRVDFSTGWPRSFL